MAAQPFLLNESKLEATEFPRKLEWFNKLNLYNIVF